MGVMAQANGSRKVLIVDADAATRRDVRAACAQDGYQVVEADTGAEGLRQVDALRPSLVLLVVTPLRLRELAARIAAHLRRTRMESADATRNRLEFRDLLIDVNERRIYRAGQEVELTHTEFDLLTFLASNAGKVLSREKILNSIWGYEYPIETRVIDVHIRNLRRKIEGQPSRPYYILAVPGIGYRFTNARPA